jgi:hypothetical protein
MTFDLSGLEADATKVATAIKYASAINFAQAARALETANLLGEITTIDDVMKVIGVFVPPVAAAANDLDAAIAGFKILLQFANGKIAQSTLDLEETIADRCERPFEPTRT